MKLPIIIISKKRWREHTQAVRKIQDQMARLTEANRTMTKNMAAGRDDIDRLDKRVGKTERQLANMKKKEKLCGK